MNAPRPIDGDQVRADFNDPTAVIHYTRAAHHLGLWRSERLLIERFLPDRGQPLLEAGCGAGRGAVALWELGYRRIAAFDFAAEPLEQAASLAAARGAHGIDFVLADATQLQDGRGEPGVTRLRALAAEVGGFGGALFLFNGLMQIPGRVRRRSALAGLAGLLRPGGVFLFTTHDRGADARAEAEWAEERRRWDRNEHDPRLREFGDRYFAGPDGNVFMHLPDRGEVLEDLAGTGWRCVFTALRREVAAESREVREFSDECRFWVARREPPWT